ncbi:MAG: glycosyltransferase family 4 protein [Phycisphaerales bacterium]|nr:MAG: glycosyltransferase family 4 protein [Phycisphaerales bacterium]
MERPKILMLLGYFPRVRGGSEYQAYLLACRLKEQYEVYYLFSHDSHKRIQKQDGFTLCQIPKRFLARRLLGRVFVLDYFAVRALLSDISPHLIYNRGANAYTGVAARYARKHGRRLVWHIASQRDVEPCGSNSFRGRIFDHIDTKCVEYGIRNADAIIGQTVHQDKLLQQNYGRRCDLIVGNSHPSSSEPIVKDKTITVVWIANLKPLKQPEVFIRLARKLQDHRHVRFIMVGRPANGSYRRRLERDMVGLKTFSYIKEQSIGEVNRILLRSHILVNTSQYEGFPNTFVQAWFRQVPVVSLNVDPDDVIKTHGLGLHSVSFEGLVGDVKRLIKDRALRESMGERAQEYARRHHSMGPNIARIVSLFETVGGASFHGQWQQARATDSQ